MNCLLWQFSGVKAVDFHSMQGEKHNSFNFTTNNYFMKIKVLSGNLTSTNKRHIKAILENNLMEGKVNRITYYLTKTDDIYTVKIVQKDRGLGFIGEELRLSQYLSTFTLY